MPLEKVTWDEVAQTFWSTVNRSHEVRCDEQCSFYTRFTLCCAVRWLLQRCTTIYFIRLLKKMCFFGHSVCTMNMPVGRRFCRGEEELCLGRKSEKEKMFAYKQTAMQIINILLLSPSR